MIIRNKKSAQAPLIRTSKSGLSRRGFLIGAGGVLALPWLEGLAGAAWAQNQDTPKKFLSVFVPNGFNMAQFWPANPGALNAAALANTSMSSLAPHADKILLINGLDNHAGSAQGDGPGDHARGTSTFLTCVHPFKHASNIQIGPSIDQVVARVYDGQTRFSSLEIGCESGSNANSCDSGYSCAYSRNISWLNATTPLPKETNPRLLFQRLFGVIDPNATAEARAVRRRRRSSVLDFVLTDARQLKARLGMADHARLDNYMTGIREIETRMDNADNENDECVPPFGMPNGIPSNRMEYGQLMADLMIAAMRCDLTRVGTFMFGNGGSNRAHQEVGMIEGHHNLSHHQSDEAKLDKIAQIDEWEIGLLAHIIDRMGTDDGAGTSLLDNTTVFFGSEIADGNSHSHYDMPIILAGRAAGLGTGRYVNLQGPGRNNQPVANLFLRILEDCGGQADRFGDDGDRSLVLA